MLAGVATLEPGRLGAPPVTPPCQIWPIWQGWGVPKPRSFYLQRW